MKKSSLFLKENKILLCSMLLHKLSSCISLNNLLSLLNHLYLLPIILIGNNISEMTPGINSCGTLSGRDRLIFVLHKKTNRKIFLQANRI
jgi:hypothetical protein